MDVEADSERVFVANAYSLDPTISTMTKRQQEKFEKLKARTENDKK